MPGSPPTSPRFGVNRYADTDTAAFSTQVNNITDTFDAAVGKRFVPVIAATNTTAVDHNIVVASANVTVTLPAPTSEHELIAVYAKDDASGVSGAAPVTISAHTGAKIYGVGLGTSGVSAIVLGTPGAYVWLFSHDGTNWKIVEGQQDTGWVALGGATGWGAQSGAYTPSMRLVGDRVWLKGGWLAGTTPPAQFTTILSGFCPTDTIQFAVADASTGAGMIVQIAPSGAATTSATAAGTIFFWDGQSYSIS